MSLIIKINDTLLILYISRASIDDMLDPELNTINGHIQIVEIKNKCDETVWKMPRELTMQEIADKFGIPVEQLRIKKWQRNC